MLKLTEGDMNSGSIERHEMDQLAAPSQARMHGLKRLTCLQCVPESPETLAVQGMPACQTSSGLCLLVPAHAAGLATDEEQMSLRVLASDLALQTRAVVGSSFDILVKAAQAVTAIAGFEDSPNGCRQIGRSFRSDTGFNIPASETKQVQCLLNVLC